MINLFRNNRFKQEGAATLIITVILMVTTTLIIIFAANYGIMRSKMVDNLSRSRQAFAAAEAGMEFGINYLKQNRATIIASPVSGYINYSNSNTTATLANNSTYTVTYTNPTANNYSLIRITSVGRSDDSTSTRTIIQEVKQGSLLFSPPNFPLVSKGTVSMTGNSQITNTINNKIMVAGSTVDLSGSARTVLSSGTSSSAGNIQSDIQQNNATMGAQSQSDFFATYFGSSPTVVKNSVEHYYANSGSTNYSSTLDGMTGTTIWIEGGSVTINGNTTIGSPDHPVLLVVNGNLSLSGNINIYGFIFVTGTNDITSLTGNVGISGILGTSDTLNMTGSIQLTYNPVVINNLQNESSTLYYARVPGSWRDN